MEQAFLRAILKTPHEDTPRLIYADWLEERGDPRSEFIRAQCQLARPPLSQMERRKLTSREALLLQEHYREWLPESSCPVLHRVQFHRGFPHRVSLEINELLQYGEELLLLLPTLCSVRLKDGCSLRPDDLVSKLHAFLDQPALSQITHWEIQSDYYPGIIAGFLLKSPLHRTIESLALIGSSFQEPELLSAHVDSLPKLRHLDMGSMNFQGEFHPTENNPAKFTPALESLVLTGELFSQNSELLFDLFDSPLRTQLQWLSLKGNRLGDAGLLSLLDAGVWSELVALDLSQNELADKSARFLLNSTAFPKLQILALWGNEFSPGMKRDLQDEFGVGVRFHQQYPPEWSVWE